MSFVCIFYRSAACSACGCTEDMEEKPCCDQIHHYQHFLNAGILHTFKNWWRWLQKCKWEVYLRWKGCQINISYPLTNTGKLRKRYSFSQSKILIQVDKQLAHQSMVIDGAFLFGSCRYSMTTVDFYLGRNFCLKTRCFPNILFTCLLSIGAIFAQMWSTKTYFSFDDDFSTLFIQCVLLYKRCLWLLIYSVL